MDNVWILGGLRSFIGVKDGMYRKIPAEVLGARGLKEIGERFTLKDDEIEAEMLWREAETSPALQRLQQV